MAEPAGFIPLPRSLYERIRHDPVKVAAAVDLIESRDFATNTINRGATYLRNRWGFSNGAASRFLSLVREHTGKLAGSQREASGKSAGSRSLEAGDSQNGRREATGKQPGSNREGSGVITETTDTTDTTETIPPPTPSTEGAGEPGGFPAFWSAYPKTRRVGKDAARKAWRKRWGSRGPSQEMLHTIIQAVEAQKQCEQWQKDGGQYIPNPATWLNQGRWEDEVTPQSGGFFANKIADDLPWADQ